MSSIYFIGCDMGGWHGTNDGLAILKWDGSNLNEFITPISGRLLYSLKGSCLEKSIVNITKNNDAKIIIAIDGALAWPVKFAELVSEAPCATHQPDSSFTPKKGNVIKNPYLYRETEKFVKNTILTSKGERPLTAPGDKFGNNSSKAQVLVAWFKNKLNNLYRPPFDEWNMDIAEEAKYTLIEVYPAASMKSSGFKKLKLPSGVTINSIGNSDIADAIICAMTAVCYAKTVGMNNHPNDQSYPDVYLPDDQEVKDNYNSSAISKEGWIFVPKK